MRRCCDGLGEFGNGDCDVESDVVDDGVDDVDGVVVVVDDDDAVVGGAVAFDAIGGV